MSSAALTPAQTQEILTYLEQETLKFLAAAVNGMLGDQTAKAELVSEELSTENGLWFQQQFNPPETGSIAFGLERPKAIALGHKFLSASGLEGEDDETAIGTLNEVIAQVIGGLASSLSVKLKREITSSALTSEPLTKPGVHRFAIKLTSPDFAPILLLVHPSMALILALAPAGNTQLTSAPVTVPTPPATPAHESTFINTRNLELLLDVEMPVAVSFGRAHLPLKDVIKLTTGSIVELNRAVSEPVDIIVNNCVIARGEVVVVEGNFGVRIKQIISKQDRLRSLS